MLTNQWTGGPSADDETLIYDAYSGINLIDISTCDFIQFMALPGGNSNGDGNYYTVEEMQYTDENGDTIGDENGRYYLTLSPNSNNLAWLNALDCGTLVNSSPQNLRFNRMRAVCKDGSHVMIASSGDNQDNLITLNSAEIFFDSGEEACLSIGKFNSNLYYASDNDKRPSLGVFATKNDNTSKDNFTDTLKEPFVQVDKSNLIKNSDARFVEKSEHMTGGLGSDSFLPAGGWGYIQYDGLGITLIDYNVESGADPTLGQREHWYQDEGYRPVPDGINNSPNDESFGYAGWAPYPYVTNYDPDVDNDNISVLNNPDFQFAKWVTGDNECYTYGRCLKFEASADFWEDTTNIDEDSDINIITTMYESIYEHDEAQFNNCPSTLTFSAQHPDEQTAVDLAKAACNAALPTVGDDEIQKCVCSHSSTVEYEGTYTTTQDASPQSKILSLINDNEYRTLNQTQMIYDGGPETFINGWSTLDVSFWMKTTSADMVNNPPYVEAAVVKSNSLKNNSEYDVKDQYDTGFYSGSGAPIEEVFELYFGTVTDNYNNGSPPHTTLDVVIPFGEDVDGGETYQRDNSIKWDSNNDYNGTAPIEIAICSFKYKDTIVQDIMNFGENLMMNPDTDNTNKFDPRRYDYSINTKQNYGEYVHNNQWYDNWSLAEDWINKGPDNSDLFYEKIKPKLLGFSAQTYPENQYEQTPEGCAKWILDTVIPVFQSRADLSYSFPTNSYNYYGYADLNVLDYLDDVKSTLYDFTTIEVEATAGGTENPIIHPNQSSQADIYMTAYRVKLEPATFFEGADISTFHNKSRYSPQGHHNSLRSREQYEWSELNSMGRFKNTKEGVWEKHSFQFQMHSAFMMGSDPSNVRNLYFLIQSSNGGPLTNGSGNFRGTVYLDNFEVKESSDFQPDADVRKKISPNNYGLGELTKYYDPKIDIEKYKDTTAPLEAQFYFYPRYVYKNQFKDSTHIIYNDFRNGMFYLYNVDWGDGTPKEYTNEPFQIDENTSVYHTYESAGIYEIKGTMIRLKPNKNLKPLGITTHKNFVLRININEGLDEDFQYFGSDGFSFIPYKNTIPIIGGYSNQSIYYKSIRRQLGIISDSLITETKFKSPGDRLKTQIALEKMDSSYSDNLELLNEFKQQRFEHPEDDSTIIYNGIKTHSDQLGKSIGNADITNIRYYDKPKSITEMLGFGSPIIEEGELAGLIGVHYDGMFHYVTGPFEYPNIYPTISEYNTDEDFLSTLPFPQYFEELNINGDGFISNMDNQQWELVGRPDIGIYIANEIILGGYTPPAGNGSDEPLEYFYNTLDFQSTFYNGILTEACAIIFGGEGDVSDGDYNLQQILEEGQQGLAYDDQYGREWKTWMCRRSQYTFLNNPAVQTHKTYWKNIIPKDYSIYNREGIDDGFIDTNSEQDWNDINPNLPGNNKYYYPVLPKYNSNGKFLKTTDKDGNILPNVYPNDKTPFPLNAHITNDNHLDQFLKLSIGIETVEPNVFDDISGNNNYGFMVNDYKPDFNSETLKPEKVKNIGLAKTSKNNGAF